MTRAVRVWADLGEDHRERIRWDALGERYRELTAALDADMAELHALTRAAQTLDTQPYQASLIPADQAGPRRQPQVGDCECGREVGTGLTAWITRGGRVLMLGPACWRKRSLGRAAARAGEQLQLGTET